MHTRAVTRAEQPLRADLEARQYRSRARLLEHLYGAPFQPDGVPRVNPEALPAPKGAAWANGRGIEVARPVRGCCLCGLER